MLGDLLGTLLDLVLLVLPCIRHTEQDLPETRHAVAWFLGKIGAAVERPALRCEKDGHRPTAVPRHRGDGTHIYTVQIRPLLTIHLDIDKMLVHQQSRFIVFEGLVGHHVAPVAGRIADAQQDGLVFRFRQAQGSLPPWMPVHRIVYVLQQIGARLFYQVVGHGDLLATSSSYTWASESNNSRSSSDASRADWINASSSW